MTNGLSQAEIDALLKGDPAPGAEDSVSGVPSDSGSSAGAAPESHDVSTLLSPTEVDAMGEVGNINMGTAATTLFALLNRRVDITTPRV